MDLFESLDNDARVTPSIDWDLVPAETFTVFESWGTKARVMSRKERSYYFFIDGWQEPPAVCLMERGIKYAKVLARIEAPQDLIAKALQEDGRSISLDRNYAINEELKQWLMKHLFETYHHELVTPLGHEQEVVEQVVLPDHDTPLPNDMQPVCLPDQPSHVTEDDIGQRIKKLNLFDSRHNPDGQFDNFLVDNRDGLTVTDKATGLMWQRQGGDIMGIRRARSHVAQMNSERFAGFSDWRLPTIEEALSLMEPQLNSGGTHTHPCFSAQQPFIFVADERRPGGYWFCDYKQAAMFWASGTIPGGFTRLCRSLS